MTSTVFKRITLFCPITHSDVTSMTEISLVRLLSAVCRSNATPHRAILHLPIYTVHQAVLVIPPALLSVLNHHSLYSFALFLGQKL